MQEPNYEVFELLLERSGVRASDVCKETGVHPSTISHWKSGAYNPKAEKIKKIADYFGVTPFDFYYDADTIEKKLREIHEVAAGPGRISSPEQSAEGGQLARVVGDSMLPSLHDGDIVRFVEAADISPADFALVRIDGEAMTVKHVEWTEDGLWVRAENKEVFEDRFYTVKEIATIPIQVVGKAVSFERRL